jgi:prepilin-type N-terminal cleavage/methylation domain-containing protein
MKQKNPGFTLIELLVVMGVLAVVLVITISIGRSAINKTAHANAMNILIADISSVKQLAVKENRYFAIEFNSNGTSYSVQRQTTIGNIANWTKISETQPLDGDEFFDKTIVTGTWKGFAINPMGVVFDLPLVAGAAPKSQQFSFYVKDKPTGKIAYTRSFLVYSNGGIKIGN